MYAAWQIIWYLLGDHPLFSRHVACQSYGLSSFSSIKIASLDSPSFWTCWTRPSNYVLTWHLQQILLPIATRNGIFAGFTANTSTYDRWISKAKTCNPNWFSRDGTFPSVRGTLFSFMYNLYIYMHKDNHPHTHIRTYTVYVTHACIYIYVYT